MADIELVIKIPEKVYKDIQSKSTKIQAEGYLIENAVLNGTPLPKGHGRLVDVNELLDDIGLEDNDYNRDVNAGEIITLENIDRISTIIEAEINEERIDPWERE